jgi:heme-degrading monooxygenase HmoA
MILRLWTAETTVGKAPAYQAFLTGSIFPQLRRIPGFQGAELFLKETADRVDVMVQTRWSSLDAIRQFAGEDISLAMVEPEARAVLTRFDAHVAHYDLAAEAAA